MGRLWSWLTKWTKIVFRPVQLYPKSFLALGLLVMVAPFLVNVVIAREINVQVTANPKEAAPAYVAIILGARVYPNGGVSTVLMDRLDTGVELYKEGKVKKILLTGDHGRTVYDEVNAMREYVLAQGIPQEDVFMDHAGFSTYDSMYRARDVFGVEDAVIVTQEFHLGRSLYIARQLGLKVSGVMADRRPYVGMKYMEGREFLARNKAFMQLLLRSEPKFLGPVIPISGDGRITWDKV